MEVIVLKEYSQRFKAEEDLELLHQYGIGAMLKSDDAGGIAPNLGFIEGYRILVSKTEEAEARKLLYNID